ncbi:MAG TPA: LysR family transcriptional regulator [Woeseiaceae bacterium]|nr:LysR family transcriptional regulator [Woeseiaceae bacterium]
MPNIGIRQARIFLAIADTLCVTRAAALLDRSQASVTKSLQELEQQLGVSLFDRSSKGVSLTAFGKSLLPHAREAAEAFSAAGEQLASHSARRNAHATAIGQMDVSDRWLDAFLAVAEHQDLAAAAEHLGLTSAAISLSLRKLEKAAGASLFESTPQAVAPSASGRLLMQHVKLARSHLRQACDELAAMQGAHVGRIVVGTLPFVRTIIVPRAITRLLLVHPQLDVATVEGPYEDLVAALRCGDIDLMVGALRGEAADRDLVEDRVLDDNLAIVARAGHPLGKRKVLHWQDLLTYDWILPRRGTPTRELFERAVSLRGLSVPPHVVETSSLVTLRGLLMESDRVTILSRHQILFEEQCGLLAVLNFELRGTARAIGITRRRRGSMSPAAALLAEEIRSAAAECAGRDEPGQSVPLRPAMAAVRE